MIRIMCIGPARLYEAMVTLSFDHNHTVKPVSTYFFTPYTQDQISKALDKFGIDLEYKVYPDTYFLKHYDLSAWVHSNWYYQQALKLCALDHFDSEYFLIQDADLVLLKPYEAFTDNKLNFKAEDLWNEHQQIYGDMVYKITGLSRKIKCSLVNEIMPYTKQDWQGLKRLIEERNCENFLDAIAHTRPLDETKWFSEYELLGIFKINAGNSQCHLQISQPAVNTWEDFYSIKWKNYHTLKFHDKPLKQMSCKDAVQVIKFLSNIIIE